MWTAPARTRSLLPHVLDESEIAGYEAQLANFVSVEETQRTTELLESRRSDLTARMAEWEEVAEMIEAQG